MSWYEKFQPYFKEGTLAQSDGDTGDSSQRIFTMWTLFKFIGITREQLKPMYEASVRAHEAAPGRYRRSPIEKHWGYRPSNFSRDQKSILNLAFAACGDKKRLLQSYLATVLRLGFHQNFLKGTDDPLEKWKVPDWLTPSEFTVVIRGLDLWILYPLLLIVDLHFLLDLLFRKGHLWDADNMLAQNLFYACEKFPTPWSRIAFHLYGRTDFLKRLEDYHTSGNGIKPLYELYVAAYDNLRGKYEGNGLDRFVINFIGMWNSKNHR